MDLRSSHLKKEYKELQLTLNGMGVYEEGMELQEMREVLDALQMSANDNETIFLDFDMQQAVRESELNFMPIQDDNFLNSTMISVHPNISLCSSPNIPSEIITIQAEVHHAMDWSPRSERFARKRFPSDIVIVDNTSISEDLDTKEDHFEPVAKRFQDVCFSNATVNNKEETASNSAENSSEVSTTSFHEICGPVSERRIHDSGFIMSGTPQSSSSNISSNVTPATTSLNNTETSVPELANSSPEIHGPVSVRRIHDSGLIISTEIPNSSVESNLAGNSM